MKVEPSSVGTLKYYTRRERGKGSEDIEERKSRDGSKRKKEQEKKGMRGI